MVTWRGFDRRTVSRRRGRGAAEKKSKKLQRRRPLQRLRSLRRPLQKRLSTLERKSQAWSATSRVWSAKLPHPIDLLREAATKLEELQSQERAAYEEYASDLFAQAEGAKHLHLLSTPFKCEQASTRAAEEKRRLHNPPSVVCIDPNTDIGTVASRNGWSKEEQEKKWLQVFNKFMLLIQEERKQNSGFTKLFSSPTTSSVGVLCNQEEPPDPTMGGPPQLLGNAQPGELMSAWGFGFRPENGSLVYVLYDERTLMPHEEAQLAEHEAQLPTKVGSRTARSNSKEDWGEELWPIRERQVELQMEQQMSKRSGQVSSS
eukprot:3066905-Prymnesium_polylepis.1